MTAPGRLRRVMDALFPWPARSSRRAAIAAARAEKERSRAGAAHAATLEQQIQRMREENHFAAKIAEQLTRGNQ